MPSDINAWTSVAVAAFAAGALWVALRTYRDSFRPVVRVVLRRDPTGDLIPDALILKNIGRGSAMSVTLIEPEPPAGQEWPLTHPGPVVTSVDVVEPLGEALAGTEKTRVGRVALAIPTARLLRRECKYRLVYQDLCGRWHETTFTIDRNGQKWTTRFLGQLGWFEVDRLPRSVREGAQFGDQNE